MATNLAFLAQCLDRRQWRYEADPAHSRILTGVKAENVESLMIIFQLTEEGRFLQLIIPQLLSVKDHVYKGVIFQTLLSISYQLKMIRFEYDPSDGEVRASIQLPLEDANLTETLFDRCLTGLIQMVDQQSMPRLKAVLATGNDPGPQNLASLLAGEMSAEMMTLLEQMLEAAKRQQS